MSADEGHGHEFYLEDKFHFRDSWANGNGKGSSIKDNFDWLASCQLEAIPPRVTGCGTGIANVN